MPGKVEDSSCKLFIGGITLNTDEDMLREFYSQWGGEITDIVVMRDPQTKRSRGFGFVTFANAEQLDLAMNNRPHTIDGKEIDPKRAVPRTFSNKPEAHMSVKRIYISGIKEEHTDDMLKDHFIQYGNITEVHIVVDKVTGLKRGFAFITFDDYDAADKAVLAQPHFIDNKRCDVKKALSKEETKKVQQQEQDRFQRGQRSRGTGRGGRGGGNGGGFYGGGNGGGDYYGGGGDGGWNQNGYNQQGQGGWGSQSSGWGQGNAGGYGQGNAGGWNQNAGGGYGQAGGAPGWGQSGGAGSWGAPNAAGGWGQGGWNQMAGYQQGYPQQGYANQYDTSGGDVSGQRNPPAAANNPQGWAQAAANWQTQGGYTAGAPQPTCKDESSFAND